MQAVNYSAKKAKGKREMLRCCIVFVRAVEEPQGKVTRSFWTLGLVHLILFLSIAGVIQQRTGLRTSAAAHYESSFLESTPLSSIYACSSLVKGKCA